MRPCLEGEKGEGGEDGGGGKEEKKEEKDGKEEEEEKEERRKLKKKKKKEEKEEWVLRLGKMDGPMVTVLPEDLWKSIKILPPSG